MKKIVGCLLISVISAVVSYSYLVPITIPVEWPFFYYVILSLWLFSDFFLTRSYVSSSVSMINNLLFFDLIHWFFIYKIEIVLFFSLCLLLVFIIIKVNIKSLVAFSKWIFFILAFLEGIQLKLYSFSKDELIFMETYKINAGTQLAKIFLLLIASILLCFFFLQSDQSHTLLLCLHSLVFMGATLVSVSNGFLFVIVLENFSLILYILTLSRKSVGGVEAGVKYFTFGTLGSMFILWGIANVYAVFSTVNFELVGEIFDFYGYSTALDGTEYMLSAISIGFMMKFGLSPFEEWIADVYAGVSLYLTAWFSIFVKAVLFLVYMNLLGAEKGSNILEISSILSIIIGTVSILEESSIKKLIAFGSIVHFSFISMAGTLESSIIYFLTYTVSSLLFFAMLLTTQSTYNKEIIYIDDLSQLRVYGTLPPLLFTVATVSLAGLPPFAGFFGKFEIWKDLVSEVYISNDILDFIFLVVSFVSTLFIIFYYLRLICYVYWKTDTMPVFQKAQNLNFFDSIDYIVFYLTIVVLFWVFFQGFLF